MDKPFSIRLEDFRKDIISTIEDSGIPPSVVRMVLSEVLKLVSDLERRQLAEDREKYEAAMSKPHDSE